MGSITPICLCHSSTVRKIHILEPILETLNLMEFYPSSLSSSSSPTPYRITFYTFEDMCQKWYLL